MPLPTVTSKAGDKYDVNSPQGKMIWNAAKNRAAASAAGSMRQRRERVVIASHVWDQPPISGVPADRRSHGK